jgi:hypothetical protein
MRIWHVAVAAWVGALALAGAAPAGAAQSTVSSGLASPPKWAVGRTVHFEASSAAAAGSTGSPAAGLAAAPPGPPPPGLLNSLGPILYNEGGGGVQHSPHVYAIFWGTNWGKSPGTETKAGVLKLYEGYSETAYEGILTQYFDATGRIGRTVSVTAYSDASVEAPTSLNDAKVQAEVAKAIEANKWSAEINNQFVVFPAPGSTYEKAFTEGKSFCAYHGVTKEGVKGAVYALIPYQGDLPFSENCLDSDVEKSPVHKTSKSASHEFAEAATDPDLNTWHNVFEVADLCDEEADLELPDGAWAQDLYDDHTNTCSHEDDEPPHVYAVTVLPPENEVTNSGAKLEATVNAEDLETTYGFEYGTTRSYGSKTTTAKAGSGITNQKVTATLTGLKAETEYDVRITATNSTGTTVGKNKTFKTT